MKILFVAQNLNIGGVQTSLKNTCNMLVRECPDAEVEVFSFGDGKTGTLFDERVKIKYGKKLLRLLLTPIDEIKARKRKLDLFLRYALVAFGKLFGVKRVYKFLFGFEKNKNKYDAAVSFFNDVPGGYSNKGTNWYVDGFVNAGRKIAWIHTDPEKSGFDANECREAYKNFDSVVCVSNATKEKFDAFLPEYKEKTHVVYNVFDEREIKEKADAEIPFDKENKINLITVGRVDDATKRMDRIVDVCRRLKADGYTSFVWRIVGDGPDLKKNIALVNEYDAGDVLEFSGAKTNPYPYVKNSDLFVLTSDYEGYPMVVGESLILGVPVVTTAFAAAGEMITDGVNGYITEMNADDIYKCLKTLISAPEKIYELKKSATSVVTVECWKEQMLQIL